MPINPKDMLILTLSEEHIKDLDIIDLIERLRDDAFKQLINGKVDLSYCYPELTHDEDKITMRIFKRLKDHEVRNNG